MKDIAIIFDMDGVLIDSEHLHCRAWLKTYKQYGVHIDKEYYFNKISGNHHTTSVNIVNTEFNTSIDPDQAALKKSQLASQLIDKNIDPIPNAADTVKKIHNKGLRLALASSSSFRVVKSILQVLDIENHFNIINAGESVKKGKPHPEIYLKTAMLLNTEPENSVVIEDSKSGVKSAKRAGMQCIGFLNKKNTRKDLQYSDFIINSFKALNIDVIKRLLKNNHISNQH